MLKLKVHIVCLDDEGCEYSRKKYPLEEAWKKGFGKVIEEMQRDGVKVRQVGDKIIELYEKE